MNLKQTFFIISCMILIPCYGKTNLQYEDRALIEDQVVIRRVMYLSFTQNLFPRTSSTLLTLLWLAISARFMSAHSQADIRKDPFDDIFIPSERINEFARIIDREPENVKDVACKIVLEENYDPEEHGILISWFDLPRYLTSLGIKSTELEKKEIKKKLLRFRRFKVDPLMTGTRIVIGGFLCISSIQSLIQLVMEFRRRKLSVQKLVQKIELNENKVGPLPVSVIENVKKKILPYWFEGLASALKPFAYLNQEEKLCFEKNKPFFLVFNDTRIPELYERALRLKRVSIVTDLYIKTLLELAKELQAFYGNKPESQGV